MVPAQASNPNYYLHGSCVSRKVQLGVLSPTSTFSQSAYPLSDTAVRTGNSDHLHQTGVSTAGLEPASPGYDSQKCSLRSLPRVGIFSMVSANTGTSNLKYVDITLYPSFQGPTSVPCFVDEVLPLNGSHREPRKTRDSNPQRISLPDGCFRGSLLSIRISSWQRRPQSDAFLPTFKPVYCRSYAGSILTPEGSGCGRRSMLHSILSARVAGFEPATSIRQSESALPLSYTGDMSVG